MFRRLSTLLAVSSFRYRRHMLSNLSCPAQSGQSGNLRESFLSTHFLSTTISTLRQARRHIHRRHPKMNIKCTRRKKITLIFLYFTLSFFSLITIQ